MQTQINAKITENISKGIADAKILSKTQSTAVTKQARLQ